MATIAVRNYIGETLRRRFEVGSRALKINLCRFEDGGSSAKRPNHYSLCLFGLWIRLWSTASEVRDDMLDSWGFSYHGDSKCLHLSWRDRCKIVYMPWSLDHYRTEVLVGTAPHGRSWFDKQWVQYERYRRVSKEELEASHREGTPLEVTNPEPDGMFTASGIPFTYLMKSGEVQNTTITVRHVERMMWVRKFAKWRLFRWLIRPEWWPGKKVRETVEVEFANEMGSERGSWKGGVIGTGFEMKPNESPEECIRRKQCELAGTFCR